MELVKMYGPSISNPSEIVNRDVPLCDVGAYETAGYKKGSIPEEPKAEPVVEVKPAVKPKGVK
jgi:hypothetical protein